MLIAPQVFDQCVVRLTDHAEVRARQRGFRPADAEVVLNYGTPTDDGAVLTTKDAQRGIEALKRQIAALERLTGAAVVAEGEHVITLYHPRPGRTRHMLRRAGRRCRRD